MKTKSGGALQLAVWIGLAVLASMASSAIEAINHHLLMGGDGFDMGVYHAISALFHAVTLFIPLVLYVAWRQAARREQAALRKLRDLEALREDLTNMLVHDLKSPLTASLGSLEMVLEDGGQGDHTQDLLQLALQAQRRLLWMIGDILDVARAEADNHMPLKKQEVDIREIVEAALQEAAPTAQGKRVQLRAEYNANPGLSVDTDKIRRVLDNLVNNAVRFTPTGGTVSVAVAKRQDESLISVIDSGPGIPHHWHKRVFDKFHQAEVATSVNNLSVGLGLSFCKLAVEAHGGRIWVESEVGQGSSFIFSLPLVPPPHSVGEYDVNPAGSSTQGSTTRRPFIR